MKLWYFIRVHNARCKARKKKSKTKKKKEPRKAEFFVVSLHSLLLLLSAPVQSESSRNETCASMKCRTHQNSNERIGLTLFGASSYYFYFLSFIIIIVSVIYLVLAFVFVIRYPSVSVPGMPGYPTSQICNNKIIIYILFGSRDFVWKFRKPNRLLLLH